MNNNIKKLNMDFGKRPRKAAKRMSDGMKMPQIKPICGPIWSSGELHLLFADTGVGKSVIAMDIAQSISKGYKQFGLEGLGKPVNVLYYDFELSDRQFYERYSSNNVDDLAVEFSDHLYVDTIEFSEIFDAGGDKEFVETLFRKIALDVWNTGAEVLIIDNISYLEMQSTIDANASMNIMRRLVDLKKDNDLSILVIAHTPKRSLHSPLTINDLAGSKVLSNFADSVSALGKSTIHKDIRYWKQVKGSRSAAALYDESNVIVCRLVKTDEALTLEFVSFEMESFMLIQQDESEKQDLKTRVKQLHDNGKSLREIEKETGVPKSTVALWVKD